MNETAPIQLVFQTLDYHTFTDPLPQYLCVNNHTSIFLDTSAFKGYVHIFSTLKQQSGAHI